MTRVLEVEVPGGLARAHVHELPRGARHRTTVLLGHGAGGGVEARDLAALASALPALGHRTVLVEQPWRVAGRRIAPAPKTLDAAWCALVDELGARGELDDALLVVGGRSAGARVAGRTAAVVGAGAVLALAFPLHPPGRPETSRAEELRSLDVPSLVVQGAKDRFGTPDEVGAALPDTTVVAVPAADHGMRVPKSAPCTQDEALDLICGAVASQLAEWSRTPSR
jgi:uncharacterized protein